MEKSFATSTSFGWPGDLSKEIAAWKPSKRIKTKGRRILLWTQVELKNCFSQHRPSCHHDTHASPPHSGLLIVESQLKIPECIHFKVLSLTYNSIQYFQPQYFRENSSPSSHHAISHPPPSSPFRVPQSWYSPLCKLIHFQHCTSTLDRTSLEFRIFWVLHQFRHSPIVICLSIFYISPRRLFIPNWVLASSRSFTLIHPILHLQSFLVLDEIRFSSCCASSLWSL